MSEVTSLLPGGRDLMNFLMKAIRTKTMTVNPTEMAMSKTSSFMFEKESPKTWCWERGQTVNVNLGRRRRSDWSAPVEEKWKRAAALWEQTLPQAFCTLVSGTCSETKKCITVDFSWFWNIPEILTIKKPGFPSQIYKWFSFSRKMHYNAFSINRIMLRWNWLELIALWRW